MNKHSKKIILLAVAAPLLIWLNYRAILDGVASYYFEKVYVVASTWNVKNQPTPKQLASAINLVQRGLDWKYDYPDLLVLQAELILFRFNQCGLDCAAELNIARDGIERSLEIRPQHGMTWAWLAVILLNQDISDQRYVDARDNALIYAGNNLALIEALEQAERDYYRKRTEPKIEQ